MVYHLLTWAPKPWTVSTSPSVPYTACPFLSFLYFTGCFPSWQPYERGHLAPHSSLTHHHATLTTDTGWNPPSWKAAWSTPPSHSRSGKGSPSLLFLREEHFLRALRPSATWPSLPVPLPPSLLQCGSPAQIRWVWLPQDMSCSPLSQIPVTSLALYSCFDEGKRLPLLSAGCPIQDFSFSAVVNPPPRICLHWL